MSSTPNESTQLQPLAVTLSALHCPVGVSALHDLMGVRVSLPKSETGLIRPFKAILIESTDRNLLLKSFYDSYVLGKTLGGTECILSSLAEYGISHCVFTSTFDILAGQPSLNDNTIPQFKVDGLGRVPFLHQGYLFSPIFIICDRIFCRQEYEEQFVAVLSLDFLREYFILTQYTEKGWRIQLPLYPSSELVELPIYTGGCCLSNGLAARDPEAKPARGGYGIHFPTLPNGWDMYGPLSSRISHTNQKAEVTAVIRALQLVRVRNISCAKISIFTDSGYAVKGLNDWIPNIWQPYGYHDSEGRDPVNAELFKSLEEEVSLSFKRGIPVTLSHIPREDNTKADALSRLGAANEGPSVDLSNLNKGSYKEASMSGAAEEGAKAKMNESDDRPKILLGRELFDDMEPLLQWTPDGVYWVQWQSVGSSDESESLESKWQSVGSSDESESIESSFGRLK